VRAWPGNSTRAFRSLAYFDHRPPSPSTHIPWGSTFLARAALLSPETASETCITLFHDDCVSCFPFRDPVSLRSHRAILTTHHFSPSPSPDFLLPPWLSPHAASPIIWTCVSIAMSRACQRSQLVNHIFLTLDGADNQRQHEMRVCDLCSPRQLNRPSQSQGRSSPHSNLFRPCSLPV
jgi:hypothetical protein